MSNLYNSLAVVYAAMYKTFINYDDEFNLYQLLLTQNNCRSVVEIGCGTGNLAGRFISTGIQYTGLDNSAEMLSIAKKNNPETEFINATMQEFNLPQQVDAAIITGRTISYLLTNKDVADSFNSLNKNLKTKGILCFDFIDASKFIPLINQQAVIHKATDSNKKYQRNSYWKVNLQNGFSFDWRSVFYEEEVDGNLKLIAEDNSIIRAFTKEEITLFLQLTGFKIKEFIPRITYAFDTFVVVAEKNN